MNKAKDDCENLLGHVLPFVEQALAQYREFFPVAAAMLPSEEIQMVAPWDGDEEPDCEDLIALLNDSFREGAQSGEYRATCVAFDAITTPPDKDAEQDTVICNLDHVDSYSVKVCFPYHFDADDELVIEEPFAVEGDCEIFGSNN